MDPEISESVTEHLSAIDETLDVAGRTSGAPPSFAEAASACGDSLRALSTETVQVNVGAECNLACRHCHVESSPKRRERMDWPTMELVVETALRLGAKTFDITGGAPELHPHIRELIELARGRGLHVVIRSNLTVLMRVELADLPKLFARHRVQVIASLPCYLEVNVDRQRGDGVFEDSVAMLRHLNELGYGVEPGLILDLVYNPNGPTLPPHQAPLEIAYRRHLRAHFGIEFTHLLALANMPLGRFARDLERDGRFDDYERKLRDSFNPATLSGLMCRHQLHVGWDGRLHDCDFNFVLGQRADACIGGRVSEIDIATVATRRVATGAHCFGCTAGAGSSCSGALV